MNTSDCPNYETLQQLILGQIGDEELAMQLEEHVLYCSSCCFALETCDIDDTLAGTVRQLAARPLNELDDEIEDLIAILRATPCQSIQVEDNEPSDGDSNETFSELGWLGPFRIEGVIASGGMGIVLKGEDPHLQRPVAIKIMKPSIAVRPDARRSFLREARAMATLSDDHIIAIHQVGEHDGTPYFVMPLLAGQSLADCIANGPIEAREAIRIAKQVASGLSAAHRSNILHKDVKPSNIWIEVTTGRVKLLDFGLSEVSGVRGVGDQVIGTPGYMSPEQARREKLDPRSDLFSLGTVLYEALSGVRPFRTLNRNAALLAVQRRVPRPLTELNPLVGELLSELVMQLMEKQPAKRIQSSKELIQRLDDTSLRYDKQLRRTHNVHVVGAAVIMLAAGLAAYASWPKPKHASIAYDVESARNGPWSPSDREAINKAIDRQVQLAADLHIPIVQENSIGMQFTLIPPGEFWMGSSNSEIEAAIQVEQSDLANSPAAFSNVRNYFTRKIEAEAPRHKVVLSKPFLIGRTEVTVAQWNTYVDATQFVSGQEGPPDRRTSFGLDESTPVAESTAKTWVSWNEAIQFCDWLSETEGIRYRLPTEAEWEYACRAGTTSNWFTGEDPKQLASHAWTLQTCGRERQPRFNDAHVPVTEVATKRSNPFGLYDMTGNAWEWCSDRYSRSYYSVATPINPQGPTDKTSAAGNERNTRVLRGGGNGFRENECRSASRWFYAPETTRWYLGFRVVRELEPK